jgi:seryl-tRNA synthetase
MTEQKKPPSPGTPDLSALWQSALGSIDEIRDVIVRGSHAGKAKLDAQLLKRQRDKLLMQIGEAVVADHKRGVPLPPSCEDLAVKLDEIQKQVDEAEAQADKAFASTPPAEK